MSATALSLLCIYRGRVCSLTGADVIPDLDHNTFAARLTEDDVLVVDVRESREYRAGHVPGPRAFR
jgi:hypothetical protein